MDMAFIWQNKYFRIVMWNRCTDYQYYNCCIVFVFDISRELLGACWVTSLIVVLFVSGGLGSK